MEKISTIKQLEARYGETLRRAKRKELDHLNEHYRRFIETSPFFILATMGAKGIDCSPRGDPAGFVRIVDEKTILVPDRRGNNRLDSLRNIVGNPQVGMIFLVPNVGETLRISGHAEILIDEALCASFTMQNKSASSVLSIRIDKVYYQCQKALARSRLWDPAGFVKAGTLPTAGEMVRYFAEMHGEELDGETYDQNYPAYMKKTLY